MTLGAQVGGNLNYSFPTAMGRTYTTEYTTDFITWTASPGGAFTGTGGVINTMIGPVSSFPKFFLRVRASLPP